MSVVDFSLLFGCAALPDYSTYSNASLAAMFDIGTRVLRGPNWKWRNQDGPSLGTVTLNMSLHNAPGWVHAKFDNGTMNSYRVGAQGAFDLFRLYGNVSSHSLFMLVVVMCQH